MNRTVYMLLACLMLAFTNGVRAQINNQNFNPASKCDNLDFRRGDFTNWVGHTSVYPYNTPGTNIATANPPVPYYYNTGIVPGRHTIISTSVADPYTCNSVMTLPPNEPFCARLGNGGIGPWGDGVKWQRDYLSYTMTITAANALLTYKYAVVLQDPNKDTAQPPHPPPLRPRFIVSIMDSAGNLVDPTCGFFSVVVDSTVAGFRNCPLGSITADGGNPSSPAGTIYRAWTTVGVDLRKYIGKSITLQFETWDCGLGGHFGYAYISARCDAFALTTETCTHNGAVLVTAPDGFSYKWFPGGQTTQAINVYNANPGDSVSVELTSVSGCKTTVYTKIYPTVAKANFKINPPVVCLKSPIAFTDSSSSHYTGNNSAVPITTWNWNFGDGTTATTANTTHTYTTAGTFTVTLAIVNKNGCTDSIRKTVQVMPAPLAAFSMADVCVRNSVPFTDSSQVAIGQTITSWTWTFKDDNSTSPLQNTTHLYNTPGTYAINLSVKTDKGCVNDTTRTIKIWPLPNASFTSTEVCVGATTNFTDHSKPGDPADGLVNWVWNFGDSSALSSSNNPGHIYLKDGIYLVQLIVGTNRGCIKDTSVNVIVHPLPLANFIANPICKGSPIHFQDQSTPSSTIVGWTWNFGDVKNNTSNTQNSTHTYDSAKVYYPKLVITSKYGCSDSITLPLNISPLPEVSFDANKYSGCSPLCVNFVDLSYSNSDPIKNWNWTFGDGSGSTIKTPSHCYPNPGVYTVALTVSTANSCVASNTWNSMISVYPHPTAAFNANPYETTESTPLVQFTDQSNGANSWHWNFGDNQGVSAMDTSHTYAHAGTYTAWLYVANKYGCLDSTSKEIVIKPEWTFYVPNAFTPKSSPGVNDGFIGVGTNIHDFDMWIFDRWGNNIYHCNDLSKPWNGAVNNGIHGEKTAQEDVYVYKIHLTDVFGVPHSYIGIVSLIN
jgi:PKD repeat protein